MIKRTNIELMALSAFKNINKTPVIQSATKLFNEIENENCNPKVILEEYTNVFFIIKQQGFKSVGEYIKDFLLYDESAFAKVISANVEDNELNRAANFDIEILNRLSNITCDEIKEEILKKLAPEYKGLINSLPNWDSGEYFNFDTIKEHYKKNGYGIFSKYKSFIWDENGLDPVKNSDEINTDDFIGYEWQRQEVIENTKALILGNRVNNVLLFGDSGTGKSATVKMLVNIPEFYNLRVIEVKKDALIKISKLLQILVSKPQKFIIFIDDLSFEKSDKEYSALKAVLEGGLEKCPQNVAIYATSNRRHMVREFFSDRGNDEVNANETVQEKTSLSDRFGIRIPYLALSKDEYLNVVEFLAKKSGIVFEKELLCKEAMKWELRHPGRTPRVARQFVDYLKSLNISLK